MKLKLYNNKTPLGFFSDFDREFENFWMVPGRNTDFFPSSDFHEDNNNYFLSLDLPGLSKKNIKISYENQVLTVSGERKEEYTKDIKENKSRFTEKLYGAFSRSFHIPSGIDQDKIEAQFSNGVLELVLPKSSKSCGHHIEVKEDKKESSLFSKFKKKVS